MKSGHSKPPRSLPASPPSNLFKTLTVSRPKRETGMAAKRKSPNTPRPLRTHGQTVNKRPAPHANPHSFRYRFSSTKVPETVRWGRFRGLEFAPEKRANRVALQAGLRRAFRHPADMQASQPACNEPDRAQARPTMRRHREKAADGPLKTKQDARPATLAHEKGPHKAGLFAAHSVARFIALALRLASFSRANKKPQKRPHRTV